MSKLEKDKKVQNFLKDGLDEIPIALKDSEIVNTEQRLKLFQGSVKTFSRGRLIFSANRDGWEHKDFKHACLNFKDTVILFKTTEDKAFGVFTPRKWTFIQN